MANSPDTYTLFKLPFDIRDLIFKSLLVDRQLQILRVCRRIHEEVAQNNDIFKICSLRLNFGYTDRFCAIELPPKIARKIRIVEIRIKNTAKASQHTDAATLELLASADPNPDIERTCHTEVLLELEPKRGSNGAKISFSIHGPPSVESDVGRTSDMVWSKLSGFELVTIKLVLDALTCPGNPSIYHSELFASMLDRSHDFVADELRDVLEPGEKKGEGEDLRVEFRPMDSQRMGG